MLKFLVISFFPAFSPPASGGELRLLNFYAKLAERHDVTLLTSTDFDARLEEVRHAPNFREVRFPKDELWREAFATLQRAGLTGELSGLAFALAVSDPACKLRRLARELRPGVDIVVHDFPYSEPIFDDGSAPREIYNAHNFEAALLGSIIGDDDEQVAVAKLVRLEHNLAIRAERVFATCSPDAEKFRLVYGVPAARLALCPNGFDENEFGAIAARRQALTKEPAARVKLLFMGSAHHPNVDAAAFVIDLAAALPEFDFIIAGGVSRNLSARRVTPNVLVTGPFDRELKRELFCRADIFLNPVELGSGTSLKAVEALAAGLPMISTEEGVRGLGIRAGQDVLVIARQGFAEAIRLFASNRTARDRIAASGRRLALDTLGWSTIARGFEQRLATANSAPEPAGPLLLALNDYPLERIDAGGKIRMHGLLTNLGADVVLVTFGARFDVRCHAPRLINVTIPKTPQHQAFEHNVNGNRRVSASDCVAGLFVGANRLMAQVVALLVPHAAATVFEHCYMAAALDLVTALAPEMPVIYSAHNVEAALKDEVLAQHPSRAALVALTADLEAALSARADLTVCCTEADVAHFRGKGLNAILVPNGSSVPPAEPMAVARARHGTDLVVGFIGSAHAPNVEAAAFVVRDLAPRFPQVRFDLMGNVCSVLPLPLPANVRPVGPVTEADKSIVMAGWALGLNPVISGGGSSLKLPDYMAHGLASLNTPVGARGFPVTEKNLGLVLPRESFGRALAETLADPGLLRRRGENARAHAVAELDWPVVTAGYRTVLATLARPLPAAPARSLLVVTYRYTEPTLGGAEEYLAEVIERIRPRFGRIDLAATDVHGLTDHHHFATRYDGLDRGAATRISPMFDRALYFPVDAVPEADVIEACRQLERAWTEDEHALILAFAASLSTTGKPCLLAGFYGPEGASGAPRRWTAPLFSLCIPAGSAVLRLAGSAPRHAALQVEVAQVLSGNRLQPAASASYALEPAFTLNIRVPAGGSSGPLVLILRVDEHTAAGDHRPLGLLIEAISVLVEAPVSGAAACPDMAPLDERAVDLMDEPERRLRTLAPQRWLDGLLDVAAGRPDAVEARFAAVRGPHSAALQAWLSDHASGYDVVLVQGIPFDTIPRTVGTLARGKPGGPRIVTLPHFHADDRFYHWRRYLAAFAAADMTLVFSPGLLGRLGPAGRFAAVPGGGVDIQALATAAAMDAFAAIHPFDRPFFLVLGRKTGSKGYQAVLRAHARGATSSYWPDLVMIGPDEDGVTVEQEGVFYLGRQPRDVVLGALARTVGLISMSESESFGIVLCEAWLFGKPVIANAACLSFRDLVRDGENGVLVGSEAELAAAMGRLSRSPDERARLGAAGRATVHEHLSWDTVARSVLAALSPPAGDAARPKDSAAARVRTK